MDDETAPKPVRRKRQRRRAPVGEVGFRVTEFGTQPVYVNRYMGEQVSVSTPGTKTRWSIRDIIIQVDDLFATPHEARTVFRRRNRHLFS